MISFQQSTWADLESLRLSIRAAASVESAAQGFADALASSSPTVILARVFIVLPMERLSLADRDFARTLVGNEATRLDPKTPTLVLLGTAGREPAWRDRQLSTGHRAIPLIDAVFVHNIPMIAKLLADLDVTFSPLEDSKALDTRRLLGSHNAAFFVSDATRTLDDAGRRIIPNRAFVEANGVRTVFGMGGAFLDGTLTTAIVFTSETIDKLVVDRFPSLISNFKMATTEALSLGKIYASDAR